MSRHCRARRVRHASLIRLALHPYADDVVIATKGGLTRSGPHDWRPVDLGLEQIGLYQLHRIDARWLSLHRSPDDMQATCIIM
jgi:aryl-alcohol dehydrogenase-like predicted oxidoreductase